MFNEYRKELLKQISYCTLKASLLELYDPTYNNVEMLKEIAPIVTNALREESEENINSLEALSLELDKRISPLKEKKPEIASSQKAMNISKRLEKIEKGEQD